MLWKGAPLFHARHGCALHCEAVWEEFHTGDNVMKTAVPGTRGRLLFGNSERKLSMGNLAPISLRVVPLVLFSKWSWQ